MSKRLGHVWFDSTIGIVLCQDEVTNELKAYIKSVPGNDEQADLKYVQEFGSSFPVMEAFGLIKEYGSFYRGVNSAEILKMIFKDTIDSLNNLMKED